MSTTSQLIQQLVAAINAADVDRLVGFYDERVTNHGIAVGKHGMRSVHEAIFTAFPDWRFEVEDLVTTPDRAVARGRLQGSHLGAVKPPFAERLFGGALLGVEPTGRRIDVAAIHMWEIAEGRVTAHWAVRDDLSLRRQLTSDATPPLD